MKARSLLICITLLASISCGPRIIGVTGGLTDAEYKDKGEKLVAAWTDDVNTVAKKQLRGSSWLKNFGYVALGVGTIGTAVAAGLEEEDATSLMYGISIATATIGIVQLFLGTKPNAAAYVKDSRKVMADYEASVASEHDRYVLLTTGLNTVRDATGMGNFKIPK